MKNIQTYLGKSVLIKFQNGRVISGVIFGDSSSGFTVKLGVQQIPLNAEAVVKIIEAN